MGLKDSYKTNIWQKSNLNLDISSFQDYAHCVNVNWFSYDHLTKT